MGTILCISNQKGGVGKTTTAMNLGAALGRAGHQVCLIDSDPQGNLTSYCGVQTSDPSFNSKYRTLEELFLSKKPIEPGQVDSFLVPTAEPGVHLIAADSALAGVENYLFTRPEKEYCLSKLTQELSRRFDFVFIDTPPSLNLLTLNALVASDYLLIPVQPEFFSLEGIMKVQQTVQSIQKQWKPSLQLLGLLPTQVSGRRKLTTEVLGALASEFEHLLFDTRIRESAAVSESTGHAKSIFRYAASSPGAQDYTAAAEELIMRVEKLHAPNKTRPVLEAGM